MTQPLFELFAQDAVDWLRTLASESIDLLITDPAYESLEKHRAVGTTTRLKHSKSSSNDWFAVFPNARFGELFVEVFRVLKRNTHFYLFCDAETMFVAKPEAERAGFRFWKPLVWDKRTIGMGYHYRARYEFILFFEKGKRRLNDLGVADVISVPRIHGGYPAEKPPKSRRSSIGQSSQPGDVVADPFMGSGSVGVAAAQLGRRFLGNDLNPDAVRLARQRLRRSAQGEARRNCPRVGPALTFSTHSARGRDGRRIRQSGRDLRVETVRLTRPQGLPRSQGRQDDHRQEPLHRRLLRVREATTRPSRSSASIRTARARSTKRFRTRSTTCARCRWPAASRTRARASLRASCTCSRRRATPHTACPPSDQADSTADTRELDHLLAAHFGWWDVLIDKKRPL